MAWSWRNILKSVAKGLLKGVSLGLIGRGRKTKELAGIVDDIVDEVLPEEEKKSGN